MGNATRARLWPGLAAAVVSFALALQLVLVGAGSSVLVEGPVRSLPARLLRLVSYFTIQTNALVLVTATGLLRRPDRDGPVWRVLRLAAVVGIAVAGLVHWLLLRPLLDLHGGSRWPTPCCTSCPRCWRCSVGC